MKMRSASISHIIATYILSLIFFAFNSQCEEKKAGTHDSSFKFLEMARRPPVNECWVKLNGRAVHKRSGASVVQAPLCLGIRFTPERTLAQIVAGNEESYFVGQAYSGTAKSTSIINEIQRDKKESILADFGLRPDDLTLSFLYWDFQKELKMEDIKGYECRVFHLNSPDKNESAIVYISTEYFFPLRVEWYKNKSAEKKPYRTLEISSFKKENDFWVVSSLLLYGSGWKTKIDFSESSIGYAKDGIPMDLFKKL